VDGLSHYPDFERAKAVVIPYGVSVSYPNAPAPKRGRVLFAGTASLRKGIAYLAHAAELLADCAPEVEIFVAGYASKELRNRPESSRLRFLGHLSRDQMNSEFLRADVFVFPTLAEGSATVIYEALAAGVPVVTTAAAGSIMTDGNEGFIIPERDAKAIALAVTSIVADRSLRDRMSRAAYHASQRYGLQAWSDRLYDALCDIL
jgi:glycosyltransferase involved in cell wall biosynthesis